MIVWVDLRRVRGRGQRRHIIRQRLQLRGVHTKQRGVPLQAVQRRLGALGAQRDVEGGGLEHRLRHALLEAHQVAEARGLGLVAGQVLHLLVGEVLRQLRHLIEERGLTAALGLQRLAERQRARIGVRQRREHVHQRLVGLLEHRRPVVLGQARHRAVRVGQPRH
jgi:hypothetical protein